MIPTSDCFRSLRFEIKIARTNEIDVHWILKRNKKKSKKLDPNFKVSILIEVRKKKISSKIRINEILSIGSVRAIERFLERKQKQKFSYGFRLFEFDFISLDQNINESR